jgi:hypothetical protein
MTNCEMCDGTGQVAVRGYDSDRYDMVECDCVREADPLTGPRTLLWGLGAAVITLVVAIVIVRLI